MQTYGKLQRKIFPQFKIKDLSAFPIAKNFYSQKNIHGLVEKILKTKKLHSLANIEKLENQIDLMVYKLYDLTYEEAKIVDPELQLSEKEYNEFKLEE